jgi:hypothetical protein
MMSVRCHRSSRLREIYAVAALAFMLQWWTS